MKILVLNCGSSSIKYKLYNMDDESVLAQGGVERIGLDNAFIKVKLPNGEKKQIMHDMPDHKEGVNFVFKCLLDPEIGAIKDLKEIDAVGHRVVQGGDKFNESVIVDKSVEDGIEELCDLAPVHNAGHLKGIRAVDSLMPGTPQVCVFDNAFHSTMPDYAYLYAIPYELYEKYHVRRYGFHGTSHRYVSKRVCEILGLDQNNSKIITCHIGNGGSVAAVLNGKVLDTSMGLTPLAGLMMGSRCGDIDASAVTELDIIQKQKINFVLAKDGNVYTLESADNGCNIVKIKNDFTLEKVFANFQPAKGPYHSSPTIGMVASETENIIYLVSTDGAIYKYILGDSDSLKAPFIAAESGVSITAPLQLNQQSGELYVTYTEELKDESKIVVYSKDGKVLHTVDCGESVPSQILFNN